MILKKLITNDNHEPVITETPDNSIKSTESVNNINEPVLTETPNSVNLKEHDQCKQDVVSLAQNRPKRQVRKPVRCRDYVTDEQKNSYSYLSSEEENHKIKRVLAQKNSPSGFQYLLQYVGEPAKNAKWVLG